MLWLIQLKIDCVQFFYIISSVCFEINILDWQEGLMVCSNLWPLVVFKMCGADTSSRAGSVIKSRTTLCQTRHVRPPAEMIGARADLVRSICALVYTSWVGCRLAWCRGAQLLTWAVRRPTESIAGVHIRLHCVIWDKTGTVTRSLLQTLPSHSHLLHLHLHKLQAVGQGEKCSGHNIKCISRGATISLADVAFPCIEEKKTLHYFPFLYFCLKKQSTIFTLPYLLCRILLMQSEGGSRSLVV